MVGYLMNGSPIPNTLRRRLQETINGATLEAILKMDKGHYSIHVKGTFCEFLTCQVISDGNLLQYINRSVPCHLKQRIYSN